MQTMQTVSTPVCSTSDSYLYFTSDCTYTSYSYLFFYFLLIPVLELPTCTCTYISYSFLNLCTMFTFFLSTSAMSLLITHDSLCQVFGLCMPWRVRTSSSTSWTLMSRLPLTWWRCGTGQELTPPYWVRSCFCLSSPADVQMTVFFRCYLVVFYSCSHWQHWPYSRLVFNN